MSQGLQKIGALVASPERLLARQTKSPEDIAFATKAAAVLFGSYPAAKAHDPEIFTAAITGLFLRYPREVVNEVVRDLPLERDAKGWDGIPSPARVSEALLAAQGRIDRRAERERLREEQFADREKWERVRASNPTRAEFADIYPDIARRLGWIPAASSEGTMTAQEAATDAPPS